jgi:nucleotide-binding universal stress UspA family protein
MRIILAIDGSAQSEEAVRTIASRPWPDDTVVRIVTVLDSSIPPSMPELLLGGGSAEVEETRRRTADQLVRKVAESLTHVRTEFVVREGDAAKGIIDEAAEWPADLIVIGSSGRGGLKRLVLGSVSQAVAAKAPCSVEIVR